MTPFAAEARTAWACVWVTWARLSNAGLDLRFADGLLWRMSLAELAERIGGSATALALDDRHETLVLRRVDRRRIPLPWDGLRALADAAYQQQVSGVAAQGNQLAGVRIRAWRVAAGLTQGELALAAGLSRITLSRLENGHQAPGHATAHALAKALRVAPGDLMAAGPV